MSKVKIEKKKSSGSSQDAPLRKEAAGTPDVSKKASGKIPNLFTEFAWFPLQLDVLYGFLASKARQELWGMPDNPFFYSRFVLYPYIFTYNEVCLFFVIKNILKESKALTIL